ncbi:MAG: pilus assembly protein N-terminal domain-containing protein, partial [Acidiferrobacterales bacterium]
MLYDGNTMGGGSSGIALLLCMLIAAWCPANLAHGQQLSDWEVQKDGTRTLQVTLYKARVVQLGTPINKVSVGNPGIADVLVLGARQVYVVGKALGTTNVVLWDRARQVITTINVEVTHDLETLKAKLYEMLPNENIKVYSSQGSIVLGGEVSSLVKIGAAVDLANSFLPVGGRKQGGKDGKGIKVLNLMEIGGAHQVMLEVKVAEMSRTLVKSFRADFFAIDKGGKWKLGAVSGGATFPDALFTPGDVRLPIFPLDPQRPTPIGPVVDEFLPNDLTIDDTGFFAHYLSGDFLFNSVIEAAKE